MTPHTGLSIVPAAPTGAFLPILSSRVAQAGHNLSPFRRAATRCAGATTHISRPVEDGYIPRVVIAGAEPATTHTHAVALGPCVREAEAPWGNEENS